MPHFTLKLLPTFATLSLIVLHQPARAQDVYIPSSTTINYTINGYGVVGFASETDLRDMSNPSSPTVNIIDGASIPVQLTAYNSSTINVNGGVTNFLLTHDHSTVNLNSGYIDFLQSQDNSVINIKGGTVGRRLVTTYTSSVSISGGNISGFLSNGSVVNITGGRFFDLLESQNGSTLNFFGTGLSLTPTVSNYPNTIQYILSGTLSDGTSANGTQILVQSNGANYINLFNAASVPEPGSVALFAGMTMTGGVFAVRKRRARK